MSSFDYIVFVGLAMLGLSEWYPDEWPIFAFMGFGFFGIFGWAMIKLWIENDPCYVPKNPNRLTDQYGRTICEWSRPDLERTGNGD